MSKKLDLKEGDEVTLPNGEVMVVEGGELMAKIDPKTVEERLEDLEDTIVDLEQRIEALESKPSQYYYPWSWTYTIPNPWKDSTTSNPHGITWTTSFENDNVTAAME